ncbi:MAG: deoxyribodipyrimidine photo-lyase, partial [Bdellovibrionales bacterium]|nr:deoxyribodipyrimidine photo-lyase [Bdellovibrionales bacterium]
MKRYKRSLCWIRRDLRMNDHHSLSQAIDHSEEVAIVFVFDTTILGKLADKSDLRVNFIFETLIQLDKELRNKGSRLILLYGDPKEWIPRVAEELGVEAVFANEDYETLAIKRDQAVSAALNKKGISFLSMKDQVIFSGKDVLKNDGSPYRVFTPYKKAWLKNFHRDCVKPYPVKFTKFIPLFELNELPIVRDISDIGFIPAKLPLPAGRDGADVMLSSFLKKIDRYHQTRDFPCQQGTSLLSVYLRFGVVSIRQVVKMALEKRSSGSQMWLSELIWREFYQMILSEFSYVETSAFLHDYSKIQWPGKKSHFHAWCEGRTGFPIVDAAMRNLNANGMMPNRCRMIVASFLVKDLLINWQWGERYFAERLLDFDLSANNGGWQWAASTGCDAQPYFRVFNPWLQSQKFDPEGHYIKSWIPELDGVPTKQ